MDVEDDDNAGDYIDAEDGNDPADANPSVHKPSFGHHPFTILRSSIHHLEK